MQPCWNDVVIGKVALAMYVPLGVGKSFHPNRPFHGLVLNDEGAVKEYCFSDGTVMRVEGGELFYLPKGSTYRVKSLADGGCYAINFDAELSDCPFSLRFRNREPLRNCFAGAVRAWNGDPTRRRHAVRRSLYDILLQMQSEADKSYLPEGRSALIAPALTRIAADYARNDLSVANLAAECGISEVYFRKIFLDRMGVSPKEYIIAMRIDYAKQLLASGQLSVGEVSNLCGYGEPCHFSREFTRRVGISPSRYSEGERFKRPETV